MIENRFYRPLYLGLFCNMHRYWIYYSVHFFCLKLIYWFYILFINDITTRLDISQFNSIIYIIIDFIKLVSGVYFYFLLNVLFCWKCSCRVSRSWCLCSNNAFGILLAFEKACVWLTWVFHKLRMELDLPWPWGVKAWNECVSYYSYSPIWR